MMAQNVTTTGTTGGNESRHELLGWVNSLLLLNYTKVEQLGSGAAYCQIIDSLWPGCLPISRVKFEAKLEHEYVQNFKVLQVAFDKKKIDKDIPVDRLVKGRFQDNFEFLQWMKKFWDHNFSDHEYDPILRRNSKASSTPTAVKTIKKTDIQRAPAASQRIATGVSEKPIQSKPLSAGSAHSLKSSSKSLINNLQEASELNRPQIDLLTQQTAELKLTIDGIEKERDFYFSKLRDIEILAQRPENENLPFVRDLLKILYATEDGFQIPNENDAEIKSSKPHFVDDIESY